MRWPHYHRHLVWICLWYEWFPHSCRGVSSWFCHRIRRIAIALQPTVEEVVVLE